MHELTPIMVGRMLTGDRAMSFTLRSRRSLRFLQWRQGLQRAAARDLRSVEQTPPR